MSSIHPQMRQGEVTERLEDGRLHGGRMAEKDSDSEVKIHY